MKGVQVNKVGDAMTIVEVPKPTPKAGEILCKSIVTSINPVYERYLISTIHR